MVSLLGNMSLRPFHIPLSLTVLIFAVDLNLARDEIAVCRNMLSRLPRLTGLNHDGAHLCCLLMGVQRLPFEPLALLLS